MKILFTGLPYFGKKLVQELNAVDPVNTYVFCDTYYSRLDRVRFLMHLLTAKKVVSFNGVSSKSGSLTWVLRLRKQLFMQWHGSDVLTLKSNLENGVEKLDFINASKSFTDAVWLKEELKALGVNAQELHFKYVTFFGNASPFLTTNVVSYVSSGKEKFYGIEKIEQLARQFPDHRFHIVGSSGAGLKSPANVIYHGWVNKETMNALLNENAIFLRLSDHDGYSMSALEAIANGNYVIWNNPHPCVFFAEPGKDLSVIFATVIQQAKKNALGRLVPNQEWMKKKHSKETVLKNYIAALLQ